jgi:hypothetical protein
MPFLALPDGAHQSAEDYTFFHVVPSTPNPTTLFGISCNQQIPASELLVKAVSAFVSPFFPSLALAPALSFLLPLLRFFVSLFGLTDIC